MVTKGRFEFIKKSISFYLNQTYTNKNLIILSQGKDDLNKRINLYIKDLCREDIKFFTASPNLTLGAMRNASVELANGDIICQWDDDDIYHPDRILTQFNALRSNSDNVASAYCDFLKYFSDSKELYWCDWSGENLVSHKFLCGTIMFYKKAFNSYDFFYPEFDNQCHVEEDLNAMEKLIFKGSIAPVFDGYQYIYVFHGENTYDFNHHGLAIDTRWGKKVLSNQELLKNENLIRSTLAISDIKEVSIRSLESVAFNYEV